MNKLFALSALVMSASAVPATVQAATTVAWTFSGTNSGGGTITYDEGSDVITGLSGTYAGQTLALVTFTTDPNNPGAEINLNAGTGVATYRAVPNTGGANYEFDNLFHQRPDTAGVLVSTGTGANEIVYAFGYDNTSFLFFNIVTSPDYAYVIDRGTFTTSAIAAPAVPEPATWAMMVGGFGLIGAGLRRRRTAVRFA